MRVELHEDGRLIVTAECSLEAFALRQWERLRQSKNGSVALELVMEWRKERNLPLTDDEEKEFAAK